jgi:hypothetical protein
VQLVIAFAQGPFEKRKKKKKKSRLNIYIAVAACDLWRLVGW